MSEALLQKKWNKFLKIRPLFYFLPFVDFVIVAGSMALGNVHEDSDFDVILGVRPGRIFTVRGFCITFFGPLGLLQRRVGIKKSSRDKICFNHFVTPKSYTLRPPYNEYWRGLYQNIVPVYGRAEAVRNFFRANEWAPRSKIFNAMPAGRQEKYWQDIDSNHQGGILKYTTRGFRIFFEFVLGGRVGDWIEKIAKKFQLLRIGIEKSIKRGEVVYKPRLRFDDEELEFHPDTRRIEEMISNQTKSFPRS